MPTVIYDEQRLAMWPIMPLHKFGNRAVELVLGFTFAVKHDCVGREIILVSEHCLKLCCL